MHLTNSTLLSDKLCRKGANGDTEVQDQRQVLSRVNVVNRLKVPPLDVGEHD